MDTFFGSGSKLFFKSRGKSAEVFGKIRKSFQETFWRSPVTQMNRKAVDYFRSLQNTPGFQILPIYPSDFLEFNVLERKRRAIRPLETDASYPFWSMHPKPQFKDPCYKLNIKALLDKTEDEHLLDLQNSEQLHESETEKNNLV